MNELSSYSWDELQAEIKRRELIKKGLGSKPQPKNKINWDLVLDFVQNSIDTMIDNNGHFDDEFEYFLYETVMDAIFGDQYWDWIDKYHKE